MLKEKSIDIVINEDNLHLNSMGDFLLEDDSEAVFSFLKTYAEDKRFKKLEIDFGSTFFEISDLIERLRKNSYLLRNNQTEVVLNLGKIDLEARIEYLHALRKLNIKNYKINYLKK